MSTSHKIASTVVAAALGAAVPAWAHHSFSIFDAEQTKTFTGVVTRVNPDANHLQIFFAPMKPRSPHLRLKSASNENQEFRLGVNAPRATSSATNALTRARSFAVHLDYTGAPKGTLLAYRVELRSPTGALVQRWSGVEQYAVALHAQQHLHHRQFDLLAAERQQHGLDHWQHTFELQMEFLFDCL